MLLLLFETWLLLWNNILGRDILHVKERLYHVDEQFRSNPAKSKRNLILV